MDSNNHNSRIPQLRFPGFEGKWEEKTLADICYITAGGDAPKQNFSKVKTGIYNVPVISNGIGENAVYGYTDIPKITQSAVTVAARGTIGYAEYRDYPYYPIIRLLSVIAKDSTIDTKFLSYLLSVQKYHSTDGGIPQLTVPMIGSTIIPIPSLLEQRTIAECLEAEDRMISAQEQKVESLKAHKKGLMQQLFPLPGTTTPALRFPGFTSEWQEKPLSHFLHEHKTKSDGKCEVHSVSVTKGVVNQVEYLGRSFAASDTSKYNLAKPGDIIYTKSPTGAFPYGIVKQNKNPYNVIVSPLYAVYTPVSQHVGYILDSYFESPVNTNNYLSSLIQKGAKNTIQISNDTFVSKSMCLPSNPAEQQKIAECLESLDSLIASETKKLESLKTHKRGLMQQLFPQPNK